jgi:uncharacterized protein (DUF58 family)
LSEWGPSDGKQRRFKLDFGGRHWAPIPLTRSLWVGASFWVVLCLFVLCVFAANFPGINETTLYYRLSYIWAVLIIVSWIWTLLSLRQINIIRTARTRRHQVGQIFEERFEVANNSFIARLLVEVRDDSTLPGSAGSRILTWIGGHQSKSYLAYTWLGSRGLFRLGPTVLASGDFFGLFRSLRTITAETNLLVVPYMVTLFRFPASPGYLSGGRAQRRRTLEVTPYAAGVREYFPGDSLNRIHWATTARRQRLMVKEFEQDPEADVWIFVDAQKSVHVGLTDERPVIKGEAAWLLARKMEVKLPSATIEYSVSVAASLANYFVRLGREVGLATVGQVTTIMQAERGERQMGKILETLALLHPEGSLPLLGLVSSQVNQLPRGSTAVLITPSTQNTVVFAANELAQRGMRPVVVLIDAASFGGIKGSDELQIVLMNQGITTYRICNNDNIKLILEGGPSEAGAMSLQWWNEFE